MKSGPDTNTAFDIPIGKELKISKGGITGMTYWLKGEPGKKSRFYTFSGVGIAGAGVSNAGVGINLSTGQIHNMEANLAMLLMRIYQHQQ